LNHACNENFGEKRAEKNIDEATSCFL